MIAAIPRRCTFWSRKIGKVAGPTPCAAKPGRIVFRDQVTKPINTLDHSEVTAGLAESVQTAVAVLRRDIDRDGRQHRRS